MSLEKMKTILSDFSLNSSEEENLKSNYPFQNDLYNLNKTIDIQLFSSEVECNKIVNNIINNAIEKVIDNYFFKKIPDFLSKNFILDTKKVLKLELGEYDKDKDEDCDLYDDNDFEPNNLNIDNWARNRINKNEYNLFDKKINNQNTFETLINSSNNYNLVDSKNKIFSNPKPIELFERNDFISTDERDYRIKKDVQNKELEFKKKLEKINNDNKNKEKLENEKKLNDNKKEFTFDYRGKLIQINHLKQNKINQIILNSKVRVKKKTPENNKNIQKKIEEDESDKIVSLPIVKNLKKKNKKLNNNSKPIPLTVNKLFDNFEMNEGVTFMVNGKKKEKPLKKLKSNKILNMSRRNFMNADKTKSSKKLDIQKKFNLTANTKLEVKKIEKIPKDIKLQNEIKKTNITKKNYSKNITCHNNLNTLYVNKEDEQFYQTQIFSNAKKKDYNDNENEKVNYDYNKNQTNSNFTYNYSHTTIFPKFDKKKSYNAIDKNKLKEKYFII